MTDSDSRAARLQSSTSARLARAPHLRRPPLKKRKQNTDVDGGHLNLQTHHDTHPLSPVQRCGNTVCLLTLSVTLTW